MARKKTLPTSIVTRAEVGLIALVVSACATATNPLTSPTEFDTLVPGWESKFSMTWKSEPAPDGINRVPLWPVLGMAVDSSDPAGRRSTTR
jgi:hypothetical protein